jgi:hypothetical protein
MIKDLTSNYHKTNKYFCKLYEILSIKSNNLENNLENHLYKRKINKVTKGVAYKEKPKVQLINLALHAILTFSGK